MARQIIILYFIFLVSCSNNNSKYYKNENDQYLRKIDTSQNILNIEITVKKFLNWYKGNFNEIHKIDLLNTGYKNGKFDSTIYYSVNFDNVEKYLQKFKTGGFVSNNYIIHWRQYFQESDKHLKDKPQNDGVPDDFNFDFVTWSQEYEDELQQIDNIKFINPEIKDHQAEVIIQFYPKADPDYKLHFNLTNENGFWLIDSIQNIIKE